MQHNKEFVNIFHEMQQELEKFLINLDNFVDKADNKSVNVLIDYFHVEVSAHYFEPPTIRFRWTCNHSNEEYGVWLDWHDIINRYMEESELSEFCHLMSDYRRQLEKALLTHGQIDELDLEHYIHIRNLYEIARGSYRKRFKIFFKEAESECNTN